MMAYRSIHLIRPPKESFVYCTERESQQGIMKRECYSYKVILLDQSLRKS
uniref:Uncharacterized protein n=1 Tax=Anguilla anguilla TaxID=7936 RepID=A0A0E9QJ15_ANGAN